MTSNLEYNLPKDAYVNFDALSLKSFMIDQLNKGGHFTDQNYEGSNISSLLDILAYYTHVLMFYLNQTSSEASFSQATIWENMNRIVKLIDYKPTGQQTSLVPINCQASSSLSVGSYFIKKYSYFLVDNIQYTFINDVNFEKNTTSDEDILSINDGVVLYQGAVTEYPIYTAEGTEYETFPIVLDNLVDFRDTRFPSHGTISVYVKENDNGTWWEYTEVDNLYLSNSTDRVFDVRLNENGHYEVKFGNGVFGKKLNASDEVATYFILSDGEKGIISKNAINGNKLFNYNTRQFDTIWADVNTNLSELIKSSQYLTFTNPSNSTLIHDAETVQNIRENVPTYLSNQLRLVTERDYEVFLKKSLPNILNDVKVVDNDRFMSEYIQYFYDICVDPNKVNRVVLNQVNFADSCDFNNVNVFCAPSFTLKEEQYPEFLSNSFKTMIKGITQDKKMIGHDVVPRDPVYIALDIGFSNTNVSKDVYADTKLVISREKNNKVSKETLKRNVLNEIVSYFDPTGVKLGQKIDMSVLMSNILSVSGVKSVKTQNTKENVTFNGLSLIAWNPVFEGVDEELINQTTTLPFFKFPFLYRPESLINRIEIVEE